MWELRTGICVKTLRGHTAPVLAIQAEADKLVSGGGDKTIRVWQVDSVDSTGIRTQGDRDTAQVDTGYCAAVLLGHNDAVTCLTLDRDQQRVISGSLDRTIKVGREGAVFCSLLSTITHTALGVEYRQPRVPQDAGLDV